MSLVDARSRPRLAEPRVITQKRADGALLIRSAHPLGPSPRCLGQLLVDNAARRPDRIFLGEREDPQRLDSPWRTVTWSEALRAVERLAGALLELGAGPERPLLILSGNSVAHALLTLAAMHVGVPVAPVSVAYSLLSKDHAKLRRIVAQLTPGVVFTQSRGPFAPAIAAAGLDATPRIHAELPGARDPAHHHSLASLLDRAVAPEVPARFAALGPDSVAKILFTSGSTGAPKGVINTQRMLCSNQSALATCWPFLAERSAAGHPPVLCDWLPWNHTFGANFNFNLVLMHGGSLWIDGGKPTPALFPATLANLRERAPSLYFNVPRGFELLVAALEQDPELRRRFFAKLQLIFYAGAALPQHLWTRLEELAVSPETGRDTPVLMVSAWGSTETAPCSTAVHWPIERAGVIGNPVPGTEIAMLQNGDKLELRVRGPNVFPGYWREPELSAAAFDAHGFYRIGDAGKLADPARPELGLVFDGRVAEDFKLSSGTWVHVGKLRLAAICACEPLVSDCVVAGHDRRELGLLLFPNIEACRAYLGAARVAAGVEPGVEAMDDDAVLAAATLRQAIAAAIAQHNLEHGGSSSRFARALLLSQAPSIDANEMTDKGYINQRAVLSRRHATVELLYSDSIEVIRPSQLR